MSCPFFAAGLVVEDRGMGRESFHLLPMNGGNRCALMTSGHSPCWMEVGEERRPEWDDCPRNPEWGATIPDRIDRFTAAEHHARLQRFMAHRRDLISLRRAEQACETAGEHP